MLVLGAGGCALAPPPVDRTAGAEARTEDRADPRLDTPAAGVASPPAGADAAEGALPGDAAARTARLEAARQAAQAAAAVRQAQALEATRAARALTGEASPTPPPVLSAPGPAAAAAATTAAGRRFDPAQDAERMDLWQRVRDGFRLPDLGGELVRHWEQYYQARPDYVQRMTERGSRYLFHITEEVERRGLPLELALLPFIESAFNPQAMSSARASGMWQFMPATGRDFALRQNLFRDDRRSVLASTQAALDYLERLYRQFGDWQLALAAYNWGQGNVLRAIENNRRAGLDTGYTSLSMPAETRNYVPKLQAVKNIVAAPERFGLALPELHNHPYFLSVAIDRDIDVAVAARLAGLTLEEFQQLNPQMNKPVILAAGTPEVLLPYDAANRFVRELPRLRTPLASWTAWVAPRTVRPADVARQFGVAEDDLRDINRIPERMLIKAGSTLLVPRGPAHSAEVAAPVADHAAVEFAPDLPPQRRVVLRIGRRGESVASVARRHRVTPMAVAQWNGVAPGATFKPGQQVTLVLPAATARAASQARPDDAPRAVSAQPAAVPAKRTAAKADARDGRTAAARGSARNAVAGDKTRPARNAAAGGATRGGAAKATPAVAARDAAPQRAAATKASTPARAAANKPTDRPARALRQAGAPAPGG